EVVALHHSGIYAKNAAGEPLSVNGTVWRPEMGETRLKWLYNEGARVSRLLAHMKQQPLDPGRRAILDEMNSAASGSVTMPPAKYESGAVASDIEVSSDSGAVTWTIPVRISVSVGNTVASQPVAGTSTSTPPLQPQPGSAAPASGSNQESSEEAILNAARE